MTPTRIERAQMAQAAHHDVAGDVDDTLTAVYGAGVPDRLDVEAVRSLRGRLAGVWQAAASHRLVRVGNVAGHLLRLLSVVEKAEPDDWPAATVRRGLDLLSLLVRDAERQRTGCPAAALDDAVECFVDQVERALRGERGARIMRFPTSRARAVPDVPAPCPTPTGRI